MSLVEVRSFSNACESYYLFILKLALVLILNIFMNRHIEKGHFANKKLYSLSFLKNVHLLVSMPTHVRDAFVIYISEVETSKFSLEKCPKYAIKSIN